MSKEIQKSNNNLPALPFNSELMGAEEHIDNSDILIPKIWLMQQMSQLVVDGAAKSGEFRNSLEGTLIDSPVEMIVFSSFKLWRESKIEAGKKKPEYIQTLNFYDNPNLEVNEDQGNGTIIHRDVVLGYYCLLASEIASGICFPYVVDFTRTSRNAGQVLATYFAKMRTIKLPSYAKTFIMESQKETNDDGTYFIKKIKVGRDLTAAELPIVEGWVKTIKEAQAKKKIKIDDSDENTKVKSVKENISKVFDNQDIPF